MSYELVYTSIHSSISSVYVTSPGQKSDSFQRGRGGGGGGGGDILHELYSLENTPDVFCAPTRNGGTGITGPQQTTDNSLIILYLMYSYAKRSLLE